MTSKNKSCDNEILNSPNWEGSHSPKWTRPQIWTWISGKILKKSLIFSEGKAWVSQLAQKRCPNLHAHSYCIKIDKIEKIRDHFHLHSFFFYIKIIDIGFFSFLFIFCFLDTQKCLTFRVLTQNLWASKAVKQIDDAFSIYAIAQRERMHLLKATGSSFLHFNCRCTTNGRGPPLYPTRWHIGGSWQLLKCLLCCLWNSA